MFTARKMSLKLYDFKHPKNQENPRLLRITASSKARTAAMLVVLTTANYKESPFKQTTTISLTIRSMYSNYRN